MTVTIRVDDHRARRALRNINVKATSAKEQSLLALANTGKRLAQSLAPYRTGYLVRRIVTYRQSESTALVWAQNPTANDGHKRHIANFNLVYWMHVSPKAQTHIKTGDRKFMDTTYVALLREKDKIVRTLKVV